MGATEQQADGWLIVVGLDLSVHGAEVEVQLAGVLRLERMGLEFDHDVALQPGVVEEEVDEKLVPGDLQPELTTDKGKPGTKLEQKAGDVANEGVLDVALVGLIPKAKEVEAVGIFQDLGGEPGLRRGEATSRNS